MSTQHRQPLAPKSNTHASNGEILDKGKGKDIDNALKTNKPAAEHELPAPKDKGKGKAHPKTSSRKEDAPRSLDRLFAIDISRALNSQAPTRYDPYYRFPGRPNKQPVYAPYSSDVLEEMARVGVTGYSLSLSEDSRCWRLNELMRDTELMKKFMENPKGWTVRLGPRGQEIDYNVEDIIAAWMDMEPKYSSSSSDDFTPDPCNTPRPSTPYCAREREYLKATMDWAGMYDRLEDQEEAIAKARSDRSRSTTPTSSSSSSSTVKNGESSRTTSLGSGQPEGSKKEQVVWKTAYEDAVSKEELGRQLDERAAKAKDTACDETDSESDGDEYGSGRSLFKTGPQSDCEAEEEPEIPRNSVFRAWNDVDSDDEDRDDEDKEEDSDDDISECDIEPDPASLSTSSRPRGDDSASIETSIETLQVNQDMGTEQDIEKKKEKDKEQEKEIMVPAPYVRPNARSFLQMFYRPPVPSAPIIESDNQGKKNEADQIPTATDSTSSLDHDEGEAATDEATDTSSRPSYSAKNKDSYPALAEDTSRTADIVDDDHESSVIDSVNRYESDEENDDYDEAEKMTPNTSFDSHSDAEADKRETQTMLVPPSQHMGDVESKPRSAYNESTALFDAGSTADEDEDDNEEREDRDTDEHNDDHDASNDLVDRGGNDIDHVIVTPVVLLVKMEV